MCYIMISKRVNNNRNLDTEAKIKKIALAQMEDNPDGFLIQYGDVPLRTMDAKAAEESIKQMPFDNVMLHFRNATVGKKAVNNVHGWESGPYQFLHNGGVSDYAPKRPIGFSIHNVDISLEQEDTDSKLLFEDLVKEIEKRGNSDKKIMESIKYIVNNREFWGRAVLYDKANDKAFLFGDWHVYLADSSYVVFSSRDVNIEQDYSFKTHGVTFEYSTKPLLETEFEGIAIIKHFSKPNFNFKLRDDDLKDFSLDEREYPAIHNEYSGARYYGDGSVAQAERDEEEYKYNADMYEPDDDDLADAYEMVPEYQEMDPFEMTTITDETGTHDEYGICCKHKTCWIYNSALYLEEQRVKSAMHFEKYQGA